MADVYRQKAHNDQLLIDTNNRLQESERRCAQLQKTCIITIQSELIAIDCSVNESVEQLQLMRSAMERAESKARELQEANNVLRDESIAVQVRMKLKCD